MEISQALQDIPPKDPKQLFKEITKKKKKEERQGKSPEEKTAYLTGCPRKRHLQCECRFGNFNRIQMDPAKRAAQYKQLYEMYAKYRKEQFC